MLRYLLKRIVISAVVVWGVVSFCFILMQLAPGDPALLYVQPEIPPQVIENIRHQMGFDLPLWRQYFKWLTQWAQGNLGVSFSQHQPVADVLANTLPNTLQLTISVFFVQLLAGTILGIWNALRRNRWSDRLVSGLLLFFYSMPGFWLALLTLLVFSLKLGWLPSGQMQSMFVEPGFWPWFTDRLLHLALPVITLSLPFIAYTAQFVRDKMSQVLEQPFIAAAQSYGLGRKTIIFNYAFKNTLLPLITLIGLYFPFILGGAVITEYIFSWPGMGRLTIQAIFAQDYPVILATNTIAALAVVSGNLLADTLYALADPRIRLQGRSAR